MKQKIKLGRKLLGFLLTLAMVVRLMPGMGLTAHAAGGGTEVTQANVICQQYSFGDAGYYSGGSMQETPPADITNITLADAQAFGANLTCPTIYWVVVYAKDGDNLKWTSNGKTGEQTSTPSGSYSAWCNLYNNDVFRIDVNCNEYQDVTFYFSKGLATVSVTGVSLNKNSTTLTVGDTETLTAIVSPYGATDKTVTWSSDNTSVATVDANGKVTAVAEGTANITVTATNGTDGTSDDKAATCAVTVNASSSGGSSDSGNSNSEPEDETPYDYLDPLRGDLKAEIALGGERTVTWNQGTALPYDIMKTLQDNPGVTLIFSYTYQGTDYKVTISGKNAKAYTEIPWYGPLYLYKHYGSSSGTAPANKTDTTTGERTYTVLPGDTLIGLAGKLNTTVESLVSLNDIKDPDFILIGQILKY